MREIKFRAWDKDLGHWCVNGLPNVWPIEADGIIQRLKPMDNIEVCQFTGLKDKNGKEIYEGDIVQEYQMRFDDDDEWVLLPYDKPDVVTMERFPVYWVQREEFGYEGEDLKTPEDFEVIGNIYENPELLEAQNG